MYDIKLGEIEDVFYYSEPFPTVHMVTIKDLLDKIPLEKLKEYLIEREIKK